MPDSYPCPNCGVDVPTTGVSSGVSTGLPPKEANRQHAVCPGCDTLLVRPVNLPEQGWSVKKT